MQPVASHVCLKTLLFALAAERPQHDVVRVLECDGVLHSTLAHVLGVCAGDVHGLRASVAASPPPALRRLLADLFGAQPDHVPLPAAEWHMRFECALRAELYAEALGIGDPVEARLAVLRGLAPTAADTTVQPLGRYRSYPLADLVDAPFPLRLGVVAIVSPDLREGHAEVLLGLTADRVRALEEHLPIRMAALLERAGLPAQWDDAGEQHARDELRTLRHGLGRARAWRDAVPSVGGGSGADACAAAAAGLGRALDARVLLMLGDEADAELAVVGRTSDLRLSTRHERSRVADCVRRGDVRRLARWETTAVIDHALFEALGADEVYVASLRSRHGRRVLLASPLPGLSGGVVQVVLAAALAEWAELLDRALADAEHSRVAAATVRLELERSVRATVHEVSSPLAIIGNYLHLLRANAGGLWPSAAPASAGATVAGPDDGALSGHGPSDASSDTPGSVVEPADQPRNEYLQAMQDELGRAAALLHDMTVRIGLPVAGADAASDAAQQSAGQILRSVLIALRPLAQARGVQLEIVENAGLEAGIDNVEAIRQVLVNLARNAIEAVPTTDGRVRLSAGASRYRDGRAHVVFEVADNGPGLSATQRAQLAAPKQSTKGGAGLGLAIAHVLARERLRGSLDYDGGRDGCVFRLWVPEPGNEPTAG